jgi:hypothetical protein
MMWGAGEETPDDFILRRFFVLIFERRMRASPLDAHNWID